MIRLYTASKLHHAGKWRALCAASRHVQCHARWLKHTALGTPDTAEHAAEFWLQDEAAVRDRVEGGAAACVQDAGHSPVKHPVAGNRQDL